MTGTAAAKLGLGVAAASGVVNAIGQQRLQSQMRIQGAMGIDPGGVFRAALLGGMSGYGAFRSGARGLGMKMTGAALGGVVGYGASSDPITGAIQGAIYGAGAGTAAGALKSGGDFMLSGSIRKDANRLVQHGRGIVQAWNKGNAKEILSNINTFGDIKSAGKSIGGILKSGWNNPLTARGRSVRDIKQRAAYRANAMAARKAIRPSGPAPARIRGLKREQLAFPGTTPASINDPFVFKHWKQTAGQQFQSTVARFGFNWPKPRTVLNDMGIPMFED